MSDVIVRFAVWMFMAAIIYASLMASLNLHLEEEDRRSAFTQFLHAYKSNKPYKVVVYQAIAAVNQIM